MTIDVVLGRPIYSVIDLNKAIHIITTHYYNLLLAECVCWRGYLVHRFTKL